ncbi:MAG: carbohydrate ABC transporter permease [Eubacteriales bacterium]|nr:carbohydrate ABC transporter permease [Eubacteriales bacterium]
MKKRKRWNLLWYTLAVLWGVITIMPLVITVLSSFKNNNEINIGLFKLPEQWRIENYIKANSTANALGSISNSLLLAVMTTILVTVVGMMAAYILARKKLFFIKPLYLFFMVGVMVPVHCTVVPISNIATAVGAKDSYWFIILVYAAFNLAQAVFLYTGFIEGIDRELDEAAIIDGCNDLNLLTRVLMPICKPILATEAIFVFIYGYSELIFSLVLLSKEEKYTVSRAMLGFTGEHSTDMGPQFAFVVMSMIPMVIVYLIFHEKVESGMLSGAVKG